MQLELDTLVVRTQNDLLRRNAVAERFFRQHSARLARACEEMSGRFLHGGRLLAFGRNAAATDAQHVSVEFVHPVIVGKRALPAIDLGAEAAQRLPVILQPDDMVMSFSPDGHEPEAGDLLRHASSRGALTFALAGTPADYSFDPPDEDPFVCQEIFEVLYHLLWETVHVFFEHREQGHEVGASSFLYPFLGTREQGLGDATAEVQRSMVVKMEEVNRIRTAVAGESEALVAVAGSISRRLQRGGKLILFGNGGSATDANDLAIDCVAPPARLAPIPAISLANEPANITAVANDIGAEAIFARQLIAHAAPDDVAVGISTSGSSPNILSALREARTRGLLTVALSGYDGGRIASEELADHSLVVHSDYIPRIQEVQASLYHVLRRRLDDLWPGESV